MIIAIITRLIGNRLISFKSSKGSSIYLSPSLFQFSLIISITANISGINKQSQKLTLCADKYASLPYTKPRPNNRAELSASDLQQVHYLYIIPCRYFRKTSEESSVRNREDIIALNRRRLSFASSQNFIFSLSVAAAMLRASSAPSPMLKLAVIFRVARKFDCTVFVKQTTRLFCLILR